MVCRHDINICLSIDIFCCCFELLWIRNWEGDCAWWNEVTSADLLHRFIFPIHPSFRIIALAEPPQVGSTTQQWLGPEILTMFLFHTVKPLAKAEETAVIQGMVSHSTFQ